jgi:hypothetical protein
MLLEYHEINIEEIKIEGVVGHRPPATRTKLFQDNLVQKLKTNHLNCAGYFGKRYYLVIPVRSRQYPVALSIIGQTSREMLIFIVCQERGCSVLLLLMMEG